MENLNKQLLTVMDKLAKMEIALAADFEERINSQQEKFAEIEDVDLLKTDLFDIENEQKHAKSSLEQVCDMIGWFSLKTETKLRLKIK